ncbi:hypothetical protein RJ639_017244 [Escallonia herrerae]|uniref:Uncharacterized protein n=1 Tax=Escallonia herrerae TaxID=1293975 RepID=A0AA88VH18_9ASTE|nr:hypothetical protein RJ639_017244 [Escallonia herrerae]
MPEPRSYDGAREERQVDNFFWHLKRYFEALDIDEEEDEEEEEEKVHQIVATQLDDLIKERVAHFTKWEAQWRKELKGQVTELQEELAACKKELTRATRQGCIAVQPRRKKISEQRSHDGAREARQVAMGCHGVVAEGTYDLASTMAIVERLEDFKQRERPRSPRHVRAKDGGDGRSKSGSPKAINDERSRDEGRRRHHGRSTREVASRVTLVTARLMRGLEEDASIVSDGEAHVGALQMVNAIVQKSKEEAAKGMKSKMRRGLLYAMMDIAGKTHEALVDTGATHNFMSPRVSEWLGLKPTKEGSWFTAVNAKERPMKGVVKNVDLRIDGWTGKADFNIIDMDELAVVLGIDIMEKSSTTLNPYCG